MRAMKKHLAIELLGGTVSAAAKTLGVSYAAVQSGRTSFHAEFLTASRERMRAESAR